MRVLPVCVFLAFAAAVFFKPAMKVFGPMLLMIFPGQSPPRKKADVVAGRPAVDAFGLEYNLWSPDKLRNSSSLTFKTEGDAIGTFHSVDTDKYPMAKCLDGTPPGFYLRPAPQGSPNATKWLIYFQGGGLCEIESEFNKLHFSFCPARSNTSWGTTRFDPPTFDLNYKRIFSMDPQIAITWHDWNVVLLRYCDGQRWNLAIQKPVTVDNRGHAIKGPPLYFRGPYNIEAMFGTLMDKHGMNVGEEAVVYGCSAGAQSVLVHADYFRELLPRSMFFVVLADSGVQPDMSHESEDPFSTTLLHYMIKKIPTPMSVNLWLREGALKFLESDPADGKPKAGSFYRPQSGFELDEKGTNLACLRDLEAQFSSRRVALYLCHQGFYAFQFSSTPLFIIQPKYDAGRILDPGVSVTGSLLDHFRHFLGNIFHNDIGDDLRRRDHAFAKRDRLNPNVPMGIYEDSCVHHCDWWNNIRIGHSPLTNAEEFDRWYGATRKWWQDGSQGTGPKFRDRDEQAFPCKTCCLTDWDVSVEHSKRFRELIAL